MKKRPVLIFAAFSVLVLAAASTLAAPPQDALKFDPGLLKNFEFRNIGPFRAGSWVTSFAVPTLPARDHLYTLYVGTRNGGVWKTTNAGTTFEPVFDAQPKLSIGDVAVAPSDANIVWVGTGEAYCARSSDPGDGVYKSTDAGKTWTNMGLRDTHHIARVLIHPADPNVVYVAAMGHLFTDNAERGVFKTMDGGRTWKKVLFVSDKVGVIDLALAASSPDTLYAAAYEKVRLPWTYEMGGPGSGVYKTTDGGAHWTRLTGLPGGVIGRIGLDVYQRNPNTLCAVVENGNPRPATPAEAEQEKARGVKPPQRTAGNEVYRSDDAGATWRKINPGKEAAMDKAPYSFNQLRLDPNDPDTVYITAQSLASTNDGGKTWNGLAWPSTGVMPRAFGDWRCLWIDPLDSNRLIFGSDGGVNISYDKGKTSHHAYNIPLTEYYAIGVDMEDPYNIYGGLQDHDSWKGPSNGWTGEIGPSDWVTVGQGDGMYNCVDPTDSRWVYNNRELGTMWRLDQKTGVETTITPRWPGGPRPRFNWTPPIALSPQNSAIVYTGAQVLFRSFDRGDHWQVISPDLTTNEDAKQHGHGNVPYCTLTTISESPLKPGVIWTGSDDGKVFVTLNGGATWLDRTVRIGAAGGPADFWVTRVFSSPHDAGTCFVAKTGWRLDDFRPCLLKTTDFGETWTSIASGLPADASVNAVIQDRRSAGLLFAGTEKGVFATLDGGRSWWPLKGNMPSVKITDLLIHPRENDLVAASYGRGLWIADIAVLQEMSAAVLDSEAYLFDIEPRTQRIFGGLGNYQLLGDSHIFSPNESNAVIINYYLKQKPSGPVKVKVADPYGKVLAELKGKDDAGLNTVEWDMRIQRPGQPRLEFGWGGELAEPGEYVVTFEAAGKTLTKKAVIRNRQGWTVGAVPVVIK